MLSPLSLGMVYYKLFKLPNEYKNEGLAFAGCDTIGTLQIFVQVMFAHPL